MFGTMRFLLSSKIFVIAVVFISLSLPLGSLVSADDLPQIKEKGVLRHLGIPYANFVLEDGKEGLDVELMRQFAQHLGVKYEYVPASWENVIQDVTGKEFHIQGEHVLVVGQVPIRGDIIANGFTVLPLREKMVNYSIPTFPTQIWLTARSTSAIKPIVPTGDIDKDILAVRSLLKGQKVLGKVNTCLDPALYNIDETGAIVSIFDGDLGDIAFEIVKGNVDLSLLDMPDALSALEKWPGQIKIIGPLSHVQDMGCAFAKDSTLLRESFNEFFRIILQDGTYIKLVKQYYPFFNAYYPDYFGKY